LPAETMEVMEVMEETEMTMKGTETTEMMSHNRQHPILIFFYSHEPITIALNIRKLQ
jgi:hypothetical protein